MLPFVGRLLTIVFLSIGSIISNSAQAMLEKNARIAIIGAGASGLTAAHTLRKEGYSNVTIYEKEERVGGKVYSVQQANQIFELGAFWVGSGYHLIDELAKAYDVSLQTEEVSFTVKTTANESFSLSDYPQKAYNSWQLAAGYFNWQKVQTKFNYLKETGSFFEVTDPDLFLPFADFIKKYEIEVFAQAYRPFWIGCGYGYYEKTPALYVLKLMLGSINVRFTDLMKALLPIGYKAPGGLYRAKEGYQQIWIRMAQDLGQVRTGQQVERVIRRPTQHGFEIDITANGSTETYDALIISTDPRTALNFLDASAHESQLFAQVKSYRYVIHLFEADALPYKAGTMIFLDAYGKAATVGHITALVNREKLPRIWTAGQLVPWETPIDQVTETLRRDFTELGGTTGEILQRVEWNYFPYIDTEDLQNGFYEKLKALQGVKSTWYVGSLLNFETVEHTAAYAKQLIEERF